MACLIFFCDGNEHLFLYEGKGVIKAVCVLFDDRIQRLSDGIVCDFRSILR